MIHPTMESTEANSLQATMMRQLRLQLNSKQSIEQVKLLKEQNDLIREVRNNLRSSISRTTITQPNEEDCGLRELDTHSAYDENRYSARGSTSWKGLKQHRSALKPLKHRDNGSFNQVEDHLKQVLDFCEEGTYQCMKELFQEYRRLLKNQNDSKYYETLYLKHKAQLEENKERLSAYECRISQLEATLINYVSQYNPNEQKLKNVQIMGELTNREQQLNKLQTALLIQEKMLRSDQKRMKLQQANLDKQARANKQEREAIDTIWQAVLQKTKLDEPFRKDVLTQWQQHFHLQQKQLSQAQVQQDQQRLTIQRMIAQLRGVHV